MEHSCNRSKDESPGRESKPLFGLWATQRDNSCALVFWGDRQLFIGRFVVGLEQVSLVRIITAQLGKLSQVAPRHQMDGRTILAALVS